MNCWEQADVSVKTERGRRSASLLVNAGRIDIADMEAISMYFIDAYIIDGKIRKDRPMPTDEKQKQWVSNMNKSDAEAMEKLYNYRETMEYRFAEPIPLTQYQEQWVDYINGKTDTMPILPEIKATALCNVNMADVPF